jgi:hypothetical protein
MQMTSLFEALCHLLDDELERQRSILQICRAQGDAARRHDIEYLEAQTSSLVPLLHEAAHGDILRTRVVNQIVSGSAMLNAHPALSELIAAAEEPWRSRLRRLQASLQETAQTLRDVVRANAGVLRNSLRVIAQAMAALDHCVAAQGPAYTAAGAGSPAGGTQPTMIDRRG